MILSKLPLTHCNGLKRFVVFRLSSSRKSTRDKAEKPTEFGGIEIPCNSFLVIPRVGSENRDYSPISWLNPPIIPSDAVLIVEDADKNIIWYFDVSNAYELDAFGWRSTKK